MNVNVDLLRRTLAHIETNPGQWRQDLWRCDTAACFAGHAALLSGARWERPTSLHDNIVITPDGTKDTAGLYAQKILGLADTWADMLFSPGNSLDDLRRIVGELCSEPAP